MELHEEILELLKNRAAADHEYINPNFLQEINSAIDVYYEESDEAVDLWITEMFGA